MKRRRAIHVLLRLIASVAILGCTAKAPHLAIGAAVASRSGDQTDWRTRYSELEAAGGRVFSLDPKISSVRIYAFRGGRAARLGHNHVLSAPQFTGYFYLPREGASKARFDLEFRLDQLELDNPDYRSGLPGAFSATLSREDIASARAHMLGEENFQAERFPFVRIHSLQIVGESPRFAANILLEMHGRQREIWVPLSVEGLPDRLTVNGSFVLRQTEFDVQPFAAMGGLLAVQDAVVIEFTLVGA